MQQWLYRRVLVFYHPRKPKHKGENWWAESPYTSSPVAKLLPNGFPAPLSPLRDWSQCSSLGWLAWDEDFEYADHLDDVLSSLGQHGWELVAIEPRRESDHASYYVFKRLFDHKLAELIEERLAVADSEPRYTQEEVEEHIRQWRG